MVEVGVRVGAVQDAHFMVDSWAKVLKHIYPNQYAFDFYKRTVPELNYLIKECSTIVAYEISDVNDIVSYIVFTSFQNNQVVHFAYTKEAARRQGIVNDLLKLSNPNNLPVIFTNPAKNENIMKHLTKKYIFDPTLNNWRNS